MPAFTIFSLQQRNYHQKHCMFFPTSNNNHMTLWVKLREACFVCVEHRRLQCLVRCKAENLSQVRTFPWDKRFNTTVCRGKSAEASIFCTVITQSQSSHTPGQQRANKAKAMPCPKCALFSAQHHDLAAPALMSRISPSSTIYSLPLVMTLPFALTPASSPSSFKME